MKLLLILVAGYLIVAVEFYYLFERMPLKFEKRDTKELVELDKEGDDFESIRKIMSAFWIISIPSLIINTLKKKYS